MIELKNIAPEFEFVSNKGLEATSGNHMPNMFGNARLILSGLVFSLRFERDRGQVFVDAGSIESGWHKLEHVLEFVNKSNTQYKFGEPPNVGMLALALEQDWQRVIDVFSEKTRILELQKFSKQKTDAFISKLFRNPLGT